MLGLKCSSLTFLLHIYFHYTKNIFLKHQYNQILHLVEKVLRPLMPQDKVQIVVWYLQSFTSWSQCTFPALLLRFFPEYFQSLSLCLYTAAWKVFP